MTNGSIARITGLASAREASTRHVVDTSSVLTARGEIVAPVNLFCCRYQEVSNRITAKLGGARPLEAFIALAIVPVRLGFAGGVRMTRIIARLVLAGRLLACHVVLA